MSKFPSKPVHCVEIFLHPGEFYFSDRDTRIRTLLGSCIAITLWHPGLRIGGMCHYMLPFRPDKSSPNGLNGRYASDAMTLFLQALEKTNSWPADYEAKIFGGGNQHLLPAQEKSMRVSDHNIHAGRQLLTQHGFTIKAQHLGGIGHRNVIFDIWSGHVWLQHVTNAAIQGSFEPESGKA